MRSALASIAFIRPIGCVIQGSSIYSLHDLSRRMGSAKRWAQWFAAVSGIHVPFELFELYEHVTWLSLGALTVNLAVVAFMLYNLFHAEGKKKRVVCSSCKNRRIGNPQKSCKILWTR